MIAIVATSELLFSKAQTLATAIDLPMTNFHDRTFPYLLVVTEKHLEIRATTKKLNPISVNFASSAIKHRCKSSGAKQLIAKAIGIKKGMSLNILDVTAGLGSDAFILATLGAKVKMLERSVVIGALLQDGLEHLRPTSPLNLSLKVTDALLYLEQMSAIDQPDVIYLDPMYPTRNQTALNKKEMQILRDLVGDDEDADQLFLLALKHAKKRVVVKRPRLAPLINNLQPEIVFKGKSLRFDVYLKNKNWLKSYSF